MPSTSSLTQLQGLFFCAFYLFANPIMRVIFCAFYFLFKLVSGVFDLHMGYFFCAFYLLFKLVSELSELHKGFFVPSTSLLTQSWGLFFCAFYFFTNPITRVFFCAFYIDIKQNIRVIFLCLLLLRSLNHKGYFFFVPSTSFPTQLQGLFFSCLLLLI